MTIDIHVHPAFYEPINEDPAREELRHRQLDIHKNGTAPLEHIFNQANQKASVRENIRCSPHTARHYFAQTCLRNGLDVYSVSRLLGHENINITKRYLQSLEDRSIVEMASQSTPLFNLRL